MMLNISKIMNWVGEKFIGFVHLAIVLLSSKICENPIHGFQDIINLIFTFFKNVNE
jgi:hypothetical protein